MVKGFLKTFSFVLYLFRKTWCFQLRQLCLWSRYGRFSMNKLIMKQSVLLSPWLGMTLGNTDHRGSWVFPPEIIIGALVWQMAIVLLPEFLLGLICMNWLCSRLHRRFRQPHLSQESSQRCCQRWLSRCQATQGGLLGVRLPIQWSCRHPSIPGNSRTSLDTLSGSALWCCKEALDTPRSQETFWEDRRKVFNVHNGETFCKSGKWSHLHLKLVSRWSKGKVDRRPTTQKQQYRLPDQCRKWMEVCKSQLSFRENSKAWAFPPTTFEWNERKHVNRNYQRKFKSLSFFPPLL